jgi:hypothetical protein
MRRKKNVKEEEIEATPFICSKEKQQGAFKRERHSTCRHMVSMAHHTNPRTRRCKKDIGPKI